MVAQAYGVGRGDVAADALLISQWRGPGDDLLVYLQRKHDWNAVGAYRYVRTVRRALLGQLPR